MKIVIKESQYHLLLEQSTPENIRKEWIVCNDDIKSKKAFGEGKSPNMSFSKELAIKNAMRAFSKKIKTKIYNTNTSKIDKEKIFQNEDNTYTTFVILNLEDYLVEQITNSGTTTSTTITPVKLSKEEQIKLNKEKLELKKKAAEELRLKTIQKKDSIAKAWKEKRAPELKKAEEIHKKYVDAWLKNNPGKTEADYVKYLEKQKKLPNVSSCDTQDPDFSHTKCGVSKSASKEERRSWSKR